MSADPTHSHRSDSVAAVLGVEVATGLTSKDAERRLSEWGLNRLPEPPRPSELVRLAQQFRSPIILTLLGAAVVAGVVGSRQPAAESFLQRFGDAIAILLVVALNAALGYFQERRAESALLALESMQAIQTRVRRDGIVRPIAAYELVPGDIVELEAGDLVPADARLVVSRDLSTDESTLTGESAPVSKDASLVLAADAPLAERANCLLTGTSVVRGKAVAIVVATGVNTELGRVSALLGRKRSGTTPLEARMETFGRRVLWVCLVVSAVLFGWGLVLGNRGWLEVLLEAVSFAVAAIPEGLPAVTTITLALGVQRMARRGAIVRRLPAVEALGSVTVLCTDKTGTLTTNQMTVREVHTHDSGYTVSGEGYGLAGNLLDQGSPIALETEPTLARLARIATICNGARLLEDGDGVRILGDPTEGALLVMARKGGANLEAPPHIVGELPFDSERKRMSVQVQKDDGRTFTYVKGALDSVLGRCDRVLTRDGERALDPSMRQEIQTRADEMSSRALRVLALADGEDGVHEPESKLVFVGVVGMIDPPRPGVERAISECHAAGVRVIMITGDHPLTARAIGAELGLFQAGDEVVAGAELEHMTDAELTQRIARVRVFARTSPEQKLRIVGALKARGEIVAMTGDGVNDAPALREAHIGVAMGRDGTEVARQAADVVITDDDFSTLVVAIAEGRAIYRNIQKFVFFLLSSNAGLAISVFGLSLVPGAAPLTPLMILWINLVTNGLPALALGMDPSSRELMREAPRSPEAGMLGARDYLGIAFTGTAMALCAIWVHFFGARTSANMGVTLAFTVLALSPLFHAASCRSPTESIVRQRPLFSVPLLIACAFSAAIQLAALLVPALQPVFRTGTLEALDWAVVFLASVAVVALVEIAKLAERALRRHGLVPTAVR
jgi:P-type Ca2+ transporter type 2C